MEVVLALDAGTTGIRAVAFDHAGGVVDEAYRELTQFYPAPGWVEHDPAEIADLAIAVLRQLATSLAHQGHSPVALGITNQRETTVAFDRDSGHVLHRAIVWQDRRGEALCATLREQGLEAGIRARTGLVLDSYFSATKMAWFLEHGVADHAVTPSFATIDSWLTWVLTGGVTRGVFVTEPSNASRSLLLDLTTLQWSPEQLALFGVSHNMLPDIVASSAHVGAVSNVVPELAGLPITGTLGDQQAALFGQACFHPGMVKATYGTGSFVLAHAGDAPPPVTDGLIGTVAWDLGDIGPAHYALEGSAFVAGAAVQWFRDELGLIQKSSDLEPLAQRVSDSGGAMFVPAFTGLGSPFWRSDARGALVGLSKSVTSAHLAHALVDALAYQVRAMTDAFERGGIAVHEIRADGGAAAMDMLLSLQATLSRVRVRRAESLEATARGAATLAGLSAGFWHSLDELENTWRSRQDFSPSDPTLADLGYEAWLAILPRA